MTAEETTPKLNNLPSGEFHSGHWPVLVLLSGPNRGTIQRIVGKTLRVLVNERAEVSLMEPILADSQEFVATFHRSGSSYELEVVPGTDLWVNGNKVAESLLLNAGDLIEFGDGGPVARFRIYPEGSRFHKSPLEVLADSRDIARRDGRSAVTRNLVMLIRTFQGIATHTSPLFRIWVMVILTVLGVGVVLLTRHTFWLEKQILTGSVQIEEISELLNRTADRAVDMSDLGDLRGEFEAAMSTTSERVAVLEARGVAAERIIAASAPSVLFMIGRFGFIEPETKKPLRVLTVAPGKRLYGLDMEGDVVEIHFTGTGFVVDSRGTLVTSRHIAKPWESDRSHEAIRARGLEPVLKQLIAYAPSRSEPFELETLATSESADVALLKLKPSSTLPPPLSLSQKTVKLGVEVLVLGYPTGLKAMLARMDPKFLKSFVADEELSLWEGVRRLAAGGHVAPLATLGIVGQVTSSAVVYDAETTVGGSGGPVIDLEGKVIAVNGAIVPEFGGSNLGVPIQHAIELLNDVPMAGNN